MLSIILARITRWIVANDYEIPCSLIHSVCHSRAPRFLAERISKIKASSSALILVFGDFKGRLLWLLNPSIACAEYRFHHLRNVGLEMPHLRQTRSASLVYSNKLSHTSLCRISLFINTHYIEMMSLNHTLLGAAKRKLIHLSYGVLKHQTAFEMDYLLIE